MVLPVVSCVVVELLAVASLALWPFVHSLSAASIQPFEWLWDHWALLAWEWLKLVPLIWLWVFGLLLLSGLFVGLGFELVGRLPS